jgi:hypothetical protein
MKYHLLQANWPIRFYFPRNVPIMNIKPNIISTALYYYPVSIPYYTFKSVPRSYQHQKVETQSLLGANKSKVRINMIYWAIETIWGITQSPSSWVKLFAKIQHDIFPNLKRFVLIDDSRGEINITGR